MNHRGCIKLGFERFGWVSYASQTRISKFVDFLQTGKIYGTECNDCGYLEFPPRAHCLKCLSGNFKWKELSGSCALITYTKVDASTSMFKEHAPYLLGLAELAEGPKVFAWIDKAIPNNQLVIGMKLKLQPTNLANGNLCYTLVKPSDSVKRERSV
jgi:uncharacterized OB-fold protein